jgi:hypothetical protein
MTLLCVNVFFSGYVYSQTVQNGGSDNASQQFIENDLPSLQQSVQQNLGERAEFSFDSSQVLDPSQLSLSNDSEVRVYFVGEGAGYHNTLQYESTGATNQGGTIFEDASSSVTYLSDSSNPQRTNRAPLLPGDYVDLGSFSSGTSLEFSLTANGANGGNTTFYTDTSKNIDGIDHFVTLAVDDSPYLLLVGVEDLVGGGDKDYNDLVFAIDIGTENVAYLVSQAQSAVPLPSSALSLLGVIGSCIFIQFTKRKGCSCAS